jgi:dihydrofolate reductase
MQGKAHERISAMRPIIYGFNASLDGYIEDRDGGIGWSDPDQELHAFWNEQERECGLHLYGRRLWEIMSAYWPTAAEDPGATPVTIEYARLWNAVPTIVFSRTLDSVSGNARLVRDGIEEEVTRLKAMPGKAMSLGGAGIAATFMRLGLVDEYLVAVHPVLLGGGKRMFADLPSEERLALKASRTLASGVVVLRYERER